MFLLCVKRVYAPASFLADGIYFGQAALVPSGRCEIAVVNEKEPLSILTTGVTPKIATPALRFQRYLSTRREVPPLRS